MLVIHFRRLKYEIRNNYANKSRAIRQFKYDNFVYGYILSIFTYSLFVTTYL